MLMCTTGPHPAPTPHIHLQAPLRCIPAGDTLFS